MAFGGFSADVNSAPLVEINMIPLIDVMLVLLVIFMITAPLLTHAVKVDLPKAQSAPNLTRPDHVALSIDGSGELYWNGARMERPELATRMNAAAKQSPQPELHLHVDRNARYGAVAEVLAAAGKAGVGRIGFVSDPH